ncbi:hypothetical protein [Streptomyces sp. NPDC060031]|uniref:hypothetical protein n=1 Tax=Streptomyces sp. NPDC060031 TaxID=3347043 RepID=UPI0036ABACCB
MARSTTRSPSNVLGTGQSRVYYNLRTNKMERVTLPWKKTETITPTKMCQHLVK